MLELQLVFLMLVLLEGIDTPEYPNTIPEHLGRRILQNETELGSTELLMQDSLSSLITTESMDY